MRLSRGQSPDEIRERHLGDIAPLLAAARNLDSLSDGQKAQVRRRVLRTVFGSYSRYARLRLTPVMVAAGLLIFLGGVAFATAGRLRLLFQSDQPVGLSPDATAGGKSRAAVSARRSHEETAADRRPSTQAPPATPALFPPPSSPSSRRPILSQAGRPAATTPTAALGDSPSGPHPEQSKPARKATKPAQAQSPRTLASAEPYLREPTPAAAPSPVPSIPNPVVAAAPIPAPVSFPAPGSWPVAPAPTLVAPSTPTASAPQQSFAAVARTRPAPASDPVLFGLALRKLRIENDATAALSILQQHVQTYPRSPLAGERRALEVEALLALHRDREALQQLDGMCLEELPRGGERLVVRGELRAGVKRWADAKSDFDRALSQVSGSPAWHERALWGRGVARLRCGEREQGMEDIERYHDLYPHGRFAAEAARFFPGK